jgi:DNA-binding NtrC family response regulator
MGKKKRKRSDLGSWLGGSIPLYVLDTERRVRVFNRACEALTGWSAAEVNGEVCHYGVSEVTGAAALACGLCPPPEALNGAQLSTSARLVHKDGRMLAQTLHFFPLLDEKGRSAGTLGIILPVSALPPTAQGIPPARELHAELAAARMTLRSRFGALSLVTRNVVMKRVLGQVELAMQTKAAVLFEGEPGTGREHLARVIHFGSAARSGAFVPLDCQRLTGDELERVLGRVMESARNTSAGAPHPGSLYLGQIEAMPRDAQEKFVRAFSTEAGARGSPPPVRLLASCTGSLAEHVAAERVRADLQPVAGTLTIAVPPLRARGDDLPLLAQHFLEDVNRQDQKQVGGFEERVWPLLTRYSWPRNLDELAEVVREAHAASGNALIGPGDLPFRFRTALEAQELPPPAELLPLTLDPALVRLETQLIEQALARSKNNKTKAAELLGINRARLLRRMEQLGFLGSEETGIREEEVRE